MIRVADEQLAARGLVSWETARDKASSRARRGQTFTPEVFRMLWGRGSPNRRPIFVVGMPRSGTTLTEQVLASQPACSVRGNFERRRAARGTAGYGREVG